MSKCKLWSPLGISSSIKILQDYILVTNGLRFFFCASGFSGLCHAFFGRGFILGRGAYWWSSFLKRCPHCFGRFVFMCSLSTFLFHMNNTSFSFLIISFGGFWQSYVSMCGHYGFRIMGIFLGPFNEALSSIIDILWWYRAYFYGGLCPIYFYRELGIGGSIFVH